MSEAQLRVLQRDCVVQIDRGGAPAGSGFLVAPGYVLTCAHVPQRQAGEAVTGQRGDLQWSGEVIYSSPPPPRRSGDGIWPEPDLAIIRVRDGIDDDHPCARLACWEPERGAGMVAAGRRTPFGSAPADFASVRLEYTGMTGYLMRLGNERFGDGISGGPVLDLTTGYVCGVAKLAGTDGDGYAVPVSRALEALPELGAAHDRYHAANQRWTREQNDLWRRKPRSERPALSPEYEAELLGLLADLPEPGPAELSRLREECAGTVLPTSATPPSGLRQLALRLARLPYDPTRPHPVVLLAELLARANPDAATELSNWASAQAAQHHQHHLLTNWRRSAPRAPLAATEREPFAAIVMLTPDAARPHAYRAAVWRNRGAVVKIEELNDASDLPSLAAILRPVLQRVLGELDGPHKIVEFILPFELFDEPVYDWPLLRAEYIRLSTRYPVVIRDLDRFEDPEEIGAARKRWETISQRPAVDVTWLTCPDPRTPTTLYNWFASDTGRGALGVPGPAAGSGNLFQAALNAGVRVAVWRLVPFGSSAPCTAQPNCGCPRCAFRNTINQALSELPVYGIPERIRIIRMDEAGGLRDLALLWDNPFRGPLPRGLAVEWTG